MKEPIIYHQQTLGRRLCWTHLVNHWYKKGIMVAQEWTPGVHHIVIALWENSKPASILCNICVFYGATRKEREASARIWSSARCKTCVHWVILHQKNQYLCRNLCRSAWEINQHQIYNTTFICIKVWQIIYLKFFFPLLLNSILMYFLPALQLSESAVWNNMTNWIYFRCILIITSAEKLFTFTSWTRHPSFSLKIKLS